MDRKEAINVLKGIIATNDTYADVREKIRKDNSDTYWIDCIVWMAAELGDLDVLKLAHLAGGDLEASRLLYDLPPAAAASLQVSVAKSMRMAFELFEDVLTPAHFAARKGHLSCLKYLAEQGVYLQAKASLDRTPAHSAAQGGYLSCLQFLAEQGADLEAKDMFDQTPAHYATWEGHLSCLKYLSEQGVDLEAKDDKGKTPAHHAAKNGHLSCLQFLAEQGVDLKAKDKNGRTLAHIAAVYGHLSCLEYLTEQGVYLQAKSYFGETPRDEACQNNKTNIVDFFDTFIAEKMNILKGIIATNDTYAEVRTKIRKDNSDTYWIDCIVWMAAELGDLEVLKLAHLAGGDLEASALFYDQTSAHKAAISGRLSCLEYLAEQGVDLQAKDYSRKTPSDLAYENNHTEIVDFIDTFLAEKSAD